MTKDSLENRLREKVASVPPRPGFETRIQAMARESHAPRKRPLLVRLALPALALFVLAVLFSPKKKPTMNPNVAASPSTTKSPDKFQEPVAREYQGLKNDAQWTMSLFRNSLPSIPISKKEKRE